MDKKTLTPLLIQELNLDEDWTELDAYKRWWVPDPKDTNFQLTVNGHNALRYHADHWDFDFKYFRTGAEILQLGKLDCVYFIDPANGSTDTTISIFSDKVAMAVKLYGNFKRYLEVQK